MADVSSGSMDLSGPVLRKPTSTLAQIPQSPVGSRPSSSVMLRLLTDTQAFSEDLDELSELQEGCWLRFCPRSVEAEYLSETNASSRRPSLTLLAFCFSLGAAEFFYSRSYSRLVDSDAAARTTGFARIFGLVLLLVGMAIVWAGVAKNDDILLSLGVLVSLIMFSSDAYRLTRLLNTDLLERYYTDCGVKACYGDAELLLGMAGICSLLHVFVGVRSARTWLLPTLQAVCYLMLSLFELGPYAAQTHCIIAVLYVILGFSIWRGRYDLELLLRKEWLTNREQRKLMEKRHRQLEQSRQRHHVVDEMVAAMQEANPVTGRKSGRKQTGGPKSRRVEPKVALQANRALTVPHPMEWKDNEPEFPSALGHKPPTPNLVLSAAMWGRKTDIALVQRMATKISDPEYTLWAFFNDALTAFPELQLFFLDTLNITEYHTAPEMRRIFQGSRRNSPSASSQLAAPNTSSGRSQEEEYQRTIGALFSVYWLMRLDVDGKYGFCFGADRDWDNPDLGSMSSQDLFQVNESSGQVGHSSPMDDAEATKRHTFYSDMDWSKFREVVALSGCNNTDRIAAMLCLTAFHDIMKIPDLCPIVSAEHAPYRGYRAGEKINDHDIALAYVLQHYPELVPSFAALPQAGREAVLFTQSKMQFNHGWFVQAEAPPGAMLRTLKEMLVGAQTGDVGFYFLHWLTDLAGADGTPLGGAEKFVLHFPHSVLAAFLWSIPFLRQLEDDPESKVVEDYLEARWKATFGETLELPDGAGAVACLRLAVMAQGAAQDAVDAFQMLHPQPHQVLCEEMARTGVRDQVFSRSPVEGGPAFLVYYGPALLQRCESLYDMLLALQALAAVYRAGRKLWPAAEDRQGETITLEISQLKATEIASIAHCRDNESRSIWILVQRSEQEGSVVLVTPQELNLVNRQGLRYWALDLPWEDGVGMLDSGASRHRVSFVETMRTVSVKSVHSQRVDEPALTPPVQGLRKCAL